MSGAEPKSESLWRRLGRFLWISCLIGLGWGVILQLCLERFGAAPHFFDLEAGQMAIVLLSWLAFGVLGALTQALQRRAARKGEPL